MKTRDKLMILYKNFQFQISLFCWSFLLGLLIILGGLGKIPLMIIGGGVILLSVMGMVENCRDKKRVEEWIEKIDSGYGKDSEEVEKEDK